MLPALRGWSDPGCALVALLGALALMPSFAMGASCPDPNADTSYTGNCVPPGPALRRFTITSG